MAKYWGEKIEFLEAKFARYLLASSRYGNKWQGEAYLLISCLLIIVPVLNNLQRRHVAGHVAVPLARCATSIYDSVKGTAR